MQPRNLADPDYEPTDEELRGLMRSAAVDLAARHEAADRKMRERIARARAEVVQRRRRP